MSGLIQSGGRRISSVTAAGRRSLAAFAGLNRDDRLGQLALLDHWESGVQGRGWSHLLDAGLHLEEAAG